MPRVLSETEIADFRERLCEAATDEFAARGPEGFTMRALAARLGVSPMTPYRYFKDKNAILAAVQARAFDRFAEALEAPFDPASGIPVDPAARGAAVGEAYARFAFENPAAYRLMFEIALPDTGTYPDLERAAERARNTMTRYVRGLTQAGLLEGDPEVIGHVFWAAMHGAVMLKLANKLGPDCDFERISGEAFRALGEGFRAKR
jgi:AcrR family transcriptional regulator